MATRLFSFPNPVNETAARVVARVLTGPRLSPLGQFATRVAAPRLPARPVPGPPKRFAQAIGATFSTAALAASVFGICLGCKAFALLMRKGVIPERICLECADISKRISPVRTTSAVPRSRAVHDRV